MKRVFRKISAVVTALAGLLTTVVLDMPMLTVSAATNGVTDGNVKWTYDGTTLTLEPDDPSKTSFTFNTDFEASDYPGITSLVIKGVEKIQWFSFDKFTTLTSVTVIGNTKEIVDWAFQDCTALKTVTLSEKVTTIGDYAFDRCTSLSSINLPNSITSIGISAFGECPLTQVTIPNGVTSIEERTFCECTKLTNITIPNSVTSIGDHAFDRCTSLSGITIPNSVTSIGKYAFQDCSSLRGITIPNNVTSIGYEAFSDCSSLESITVPASVTSIGDYVFQNCSSLKTATFEGTTPPTNVSTSSYFPGRLFDYSGITAIYVPCTAVDTYKSDTYKDLFEGYIDKIQPKHGETEIRNAKTATCTQKGYTGDTCCKLCGTTLESGSDIAMTAHSVSKVSAKAATCTADGNKEYWHCSGCGKNFTTQSCTAEITDTVIPKLGHSFSTSWSKDGTSHWHECTHSGCTEKSGNAAHSYGSWTLTSKPTLTAAGTAKHTCTVCGYSNTIAVPKLTDTTVWTKDESRHIEPTEENTGKDVYTSTDYGEVEVVLPKKEHTHVWGDWAITANPTLTETGTAERVCTKNGTHKETENLPNLKDEAFWIKQTDRHVDPSVNGTGTEVYHNDTYGDVTVTIPELSNTAVWGTPARTDPTKTNDGEDVYTSADYGTVTVTVPKLTDPIWGAPVRTDPTKTNDGEDVYTSNDYGQVTITIPKLTDPIWTKDDTRHTDPTEDEDGKDVYTSTDYGDVTVILPALDHTHVWGDWTITANPTLTLTGTAQRVCTKNSAHKDTKALPVLTDASVWTKDDTRHVDPTEKAEGKDVYTSEYGDVTLPIEKLPHTHVLTHVDEVPPTEEKEGVKEHWHCDGCDKDFLDKDGDTEATADDLRIGKIETEVQAPEKFPKPEISTPKKEIISMVLTQEEQEKVKEGVDIKIILKVEDASDSAPTEDKEKIETAVGSLEDYRLGQYLDVTLLKKIGEQEHEAITSTSKPITVTFEIPENLRGMAKYTVIRIHGGETTILEDEDSDPNTVTIKTDKFSTYALTYQAKAAAAEPNGNGAVPTITPVQNDNSDTTSSESGTSSAAVSTDNESAQAPSGENSVSDEDNTDNRDGNPSTGAAISLVPLAAALAFVTAAKRKKK